MYYHRVAIPCLFLVGLHCEQVVDFFIPRDIILILIEIFLILLFVSFFLFQLSAVQYHACTEPSLFPPLV